MTKFYSIGKTMRIITLIFCIIIVSFNLSQCSAIDFSRRVSQQGNLLPQDKISRLKPGMSKEDVAILMGTSLISSTFNNNRWDYAYTWRKGSGAMAIRHVSVYFSGSTLVRVEQSS